MQRNNKREGKNDFPNSMRRIVFYRVVIAVVFCLSLIMMNRQTSAESWKQLPEASSKTGAGPDDPVYVTGYPVIKSYPRVYMRKVSSGVRPITSASTSTAAFVGVTEKGPVDEARRITNWAQFQRIYGTFIPGSYLAESVFQFFHNGGNQCYIVRVSHRYAAKERLVRVVKPGKDGIKIPKETAFIKAFSLLDKITDFSLLAVPGIGTTTMVDAGMEYCRNRPLQDVFYIGEMGQDEDTPADAETFRKSLSRPNSYGAVYFPWIKALDPARKSKEPILLPPSGYIAGLFARIDSTRGVWKAPAGTEATLNGAVGLAYNLTDVEQENLNRININSIRRFPNVGIVSWGARTITSDPEWKYVPVRRMAIMLRVSIYRGIQWAVFEPNDEELWAKLRLNLNSFMMTLFRRGAFQGAAPNEAFFIKCDSETTTQADINLGIVNVLVGFAPLKPAEFVVVKISQKAGQAPVSPVAK